MRTTAAFISGMATTGILAAGVFVGTGVLDGNTGNQQASGGNGNSSSSGSGKGSSNSGNASGSSTQTAGNTSAASVTDGTFDGPVVQTPYGPMQVEIVIAGGKITDAKTLQQPGGDPTSNSINSQVIPILVKATTDYQTAKFGNVSRATISSNAYKQSAQGALDQAGYTG